MLVEVVTLILGRGRDAQRGKKRSRSTWTEMSRAVGNDFAGRYPFARGVTSGRVRTSLGLCLA